MTDPLGPVGEGQTELPDEVREGLIPTYIATIGDLYEAEEQNIADGTLGRSPTVDELLDDLYLRALHKAMFGKVWRWAGTYRRLETNIGIDPLDIPAAIRNLVEDSKTWVSNSTFPPDELAVRFHHRLVQIHAFPNGNGRHGRFAAEYLVEGLGQPRFTWGAGLALDLSELRTRYRAALQSMDRDREDVQPLLAFVRS